MIAHNPNIRDISNRIQDIRNIRGKNFKYKVYLGPNSESFCNSESEFEKQCLVYFERYYKSLAENGPLILSWKVKDCWEYLEKFTHHMHCWCKKTNFPPSMQGLVLPSFSILKHLEWYGFSEEMIRNYLKVDRITDELSTIVYNPQESAVLLLHKAKSEKLATDIELLIHYLKLFILLFHNVLKNMKLIPFVVINENFNPDDADCDLCLNHVLSEKEIADFPNYLESKECYFQTGYRNKVKEDLSNIFLAKVLGVLAAASMHPNHIPMFINDQNSKKEMEQVKVLLTPEQMDIFCSQNKHMIIKGGFGCGKTIIAATMLEKIVQSLKNDEKLFHICYEARSELLSKMVRNTQENDKVSPFHNKDGLMLSAIIDQITKRDRSKKINFVVDEYDGEDLDNSEADKLSKIFNESLKESYIVLIAQPIEKKRVIKTHRVVKTAQQKKNRFDILEKTMKPYYLTSNMRNSKQIHELVEATKEVLKEQQTVFIHPKDRKIGDEIEEREKNMTSNKSEEAQEKVESSEESSVSKERISKHDDHQEFEINTNRIENNKCSGKNFLSDELEVEPKQEIKELLEGNHINTKTGLDGAESIKGSPMLNTKKNKDGSINEDHQELEIDAEHESKGQSVKGYGDSILGLDEAQAIVGSRMENDTSGNRTVSKFSHEKVDKIGHNIETERPLLFELGDKEEFDKSLSLVAIFDKLRITSSKHVVLHFDTETNAIPSALRFAFDHHFNNIKKTTNYKDFQSSNKSILVCSYPSFRGLEYSRVTVLIDRDIYFQQHYLVEILARCTSELSVVVLRNSEALDYVIEKWKTGELVHHWKTEISLKDNQNEDYQLLCIDEQKTINGKFRSKYYKDLKETFDSSSINNETTVFNIKQAAWKTIYKKR